MCANLYTYIPGRCKNSSVGQSARLSILRSSVRFRQTPPPKKTPKNLNLHGFELHRPSSKGTKLLFQVIKAIINTHIDLCVCFGGHLCKQCYLLFQNFFFLDCPSPPPIRRVRALVHLSRCYPYLLSCVIVGVVGREEQVREKIESREEEREDKETF